MAVKNIDIIQRPEERTCEKCGRVECWNDEEIVWEIAMTGGERAVGSVYCIHEWDINGTFVPIDEYTDSPSMG